MYKSEDGQFEVQVDGDYYRFIFANGHTETRRIASVGEVNSGNKRAMNLITINDPENPDVHYCFWSNGQIERQQVFRPGENHIEPSTLAMLKQFRLEKPSIHFVVTAPGEYRQFAGREARSPSAKILAECHTEDEAEAKANAYGDQCIILRLVDFKFFERWSNR